MNITHTMANDTIAQRPKRHYYSPELKGQIVAECQVSGASVAGVARHGMPTSFIGDPSKQTP
jgi:transposase